MRTPSAFVCRPICIEKHWFPLLLGSSGSGGIQWGPMGSKLDSRRTHADPLRFRVQTHTHRKTMVSIASGLIWIRWDPMGVKLGPMGVQWGSMWAYADHSHFRVQTHMHRKALAFRASGLIWITPRCIRVRAWLHTPRLPRALYGRHCLAPPRDSVRLIEA